MSESLAGVVESIRRAGDVLDEAGRHVSAADPGPGTFGAGGPGRLGELGRDLYLRWERGVDARVREAQAHAARLHRLADAISRTAGRFADADDSARSLHRDSDGSSAGVP